MQPTNHQICSPLYLIMGQQTRPCRNKKDLFTSLTSLFVGVVRKRYDDHHQMNAEWQQILNE